MTDQKKSKTKLVAAILGVIGSVVVATFIVLITFSVKSARKIIVTDTAENVQVITKGYADAVSYWISTGLAALDMYTKSDVVANSESPEEIGRWLTTTTNRRYEHFEYVLFIDANGNSYYDSGKTGNHSDRAYYKKIASGKASYSIENPTIAKATGRVSVMVVKAAYDSNHKLVGMFVGVHALKFLQDEIAALKLGQEGFAFLLDGNGVVISHKNPNYAIYKNFVSDEEFPADLKEIANDMIAGNASTGYAYKGTPEEMLLRMNQ